MFTKKQKFFFEKLRELVHEKGHFPTVREIGQATGLSSPATVHAYLNRLHCKGHLEKQGKSWTITEIFSTIPLMGIVPAGSPLEIFEPLGEEIELPDWMTARGGDVIAFRVQGESMRDAYIQEGDIVLIRRTAHAEPGEMVVAMLNDDSITLKRLKKEKSRFWLEPENPEYSPIFDSFQVVGKVIGVLRKYR
jgi:repressor LexA